MTTNGAVTFTDLGLREVPPRLSDYEETWEQQRAVHAAVASGELDPQVLFVQHAPVYTAGRRTAPEMRPQDGTPVIEVDRGGLITYHGPGQLVGYPIVPLPDRVGPLAYVRRLEEAVIRTLRDYGIESGRVEGRTGVWLAPDPARLLGERKICAIGVRVAKRTTLHGFALNVTRQSTGPFGGIIPCGIADAGVTCLEAELGGRPVPTLSEVMDALVPHLSELLTWRPFEPSGWDGVHDSGAEAGA